jgi:NAD(P)-dependent dehydrogenase (short-subunit alcohol dehydrogenase family)
LLPQNSFSGAVALVTGGSSGIGEGIAVKLAGLGATVAVYGRRAEPLQRVVEQIRAAGGSATSLTGDVRDRQRVEEVLDELTGEYGPVTHLVNNAAGNFRVQPEELTPNGWDAVVDIVLNGTWNFTQTVAQRNLRAGLPLSVVCIGTVGALSGGPTTAHSATAKAGVLAMVKSLAGAWGPAGIRLNMVTPGPISNTGGARALIGSDEQRRTLLGELPLRRFGTIDEVADAVTYLLSDYAAFITGANLVVDGGIALGR